MGKTWKDRKTPKSNFLDVEVPRGTQIAVIGDIHEHPEQFQAMLEKLKPSENMWAVFVGDIYDKGFGIKCAESITDQIKDLHEYGVAYAIRGNHELKVIRKAKHDKNLMTEQLKWWRTMPLSLSFKFNNGTRLTVVHAGVTPRQTWESLHKDVEICYVRDVDEDGKMIPLKWVVDENGEKKLVKAKEGGKSWHEIYDGRFGYIAAGHAAQKDGEAKFYNYSCNLDSGVYDTGVLTAQIFNDDGSKNEKVTVKGTPAKPKLNIGY